MSHTIKKSLLVFTVILTFSLIYYINLTPECASCQLEGQDSLLEEQVSLNVLKQNHNEVVKSAVFVDQKATESKMRVIKRFDDPWCIGKLELNDSDYAFAQKQVEDWDIQQGKVKAKNETIGLAELGIDYPADYDDEYYPKNAFIESYEQLPIEELKALAFDDDKWAMVAFVQKNSFAHTNAKLEVAQRLLVKGSPYYALEEIVVYILSLAKTVYTQTGDPNKSNDLVIDALAYLYWGLENYSDGALTAFNALTTREPFKTQIPLEILLADSEGEIKRRYEKVNQRIQDERDKFGIKFEEPPKGAKIAFAENIATQKRLYPYSMNVISQFKVTAHDRLNQTPCINEHLAYAEEKLKDLL